MPKEVRSRESKRKKVQRQIQLHEGNLAKDSNSSISKEYWKLQKNLKAYIYSKYTDKEMKMEMDQKEINEVTEIHFANSGVEIKSDSELDEQVQTVQKR